MGPCSGNNVGGVCMLWAGAGVGFGAGGGWIKGGCPLAKGGSAVVGLSGVGTGTTGTFCGDKVEPLFPCGPFGKGRA